MDCIQSSNKAVDLHGAGRHGFSPGNPGAGVLATYLTPAWCNGVQEEILNVIRAGGLVPSGVDLSQMLQAINILVAVRTGGPGEVKTFARTSAPAGFLKCNGAAVSRITYAALFAVIGTTYGVGDGSTTFNLPDLRGEFVRGLDDGRGVDTGRTLAAAQAQQLLQHTHGVTDPQHSHGVTDPQHSHTVSASTVATGAGTGAGQFVDSNETPVQTDTYNTSAASTGVTVQNAGTGISIQNSVGGAELRPRNMALLYCISF